MANYHPENYWSEVADRIQSREGNNVIAGDDEPYYRYKRERFLQMLNSLSLKGRSILEIGNGPGGNLKEVWKSKPAKLQGVDISAKMVEIARSHLPKEIEITKIDGTTLPFSDDTFNMVFSATVLQHNTDEEMLKKIMGEMARVSNEQVVFFERIESSIKGDELCMGRPVSYYQAFMESRGFYLEKAEFINIQISYLVCGAIRKLFNPRNRQEGEPLSKLSLFLQNITLPVTKILDKIFTSKRDLGKLVFRLKEAA
jgi:ubiquinone/menaquinone biosynthesis C-methylase UbiE